MRKTSVTNLSFDIWHIGIPVKNLENSLKFYVDTLGFEFLGIYQDTMAFVSPPGKSFTLELMKLGEERKSEFNKKAHHIAFECGDLEAFHAQLVKKGLISVPEIQPSNNGMRLFSVKDPDGVTIQFYKGRAGFDRFLSTQIDNNSEIL